MINTSAQNALKNSVYNFIGFLMPIVILIFFTPIFISRLGVDEYGIYIFLNTILTFLGLLELGIGVATSKHIIEYYSTNQKEKLSKLLFSMNSIYLIMAFVYFIVCFVIGVILQFTKFDSFHNYILLLSIVGLTGFISTFFANFVNIITTMQRYDLYQKISLFFLFLSNLLMLVLVILGYKLLSVLLMQLIIAFLSCLIFFFSARKIFKPLKLFFCWDIEEIINNYKFAIPVAFNNLANSSLVHFDKILIPVFLGASSLTYYSVPGSIANKISSLSGSVSSILFPITVNLNAVQDLQKIKRVYIRSVRLIMIFSTAIALSILLISDKILLYWLGADFLKQSLLVLIFLVITNLLLALLSPLSNLLMAIGKMKFLTISSFIMALINIISLMILLPKFGINGAALSYLISVSYIFFMYYYSDKYYFKINEKLHYRLFFKLALTALPFFILVRFILKNMIYNFFTLAIIGPCCILLFLIIYKIFRFVEYEDWLDLKLFINKAINKFQNLYE